MPKETKFHSRMYAIKDYTRPDASWVSEVDPELRPYWPLVLAALESVSHVQAIQLVEKFLAKNDANTVDDKALETLIMDLCNCYGKSTGVVGRSVTPPDSFRNGEVLVAKICPNTGAKYASYGDNPAVAVPHNKTLINAQYGAQAAEQYEDCIKLAISKVRAVAKDDGAVIPASSGSQAEIKANITQFSKEVITLEFGQKVARVFRSEDVKMHPGYTYLMKTLFIAPPPEEIPGRVTLLCKQLSAMLKTSKNAYQIAGKAYELNLIVAGDRRYFLDVPMFMNAMLMLAGKPAMHIDEQAAKLAQEEGRLAGYLVDAASNVALQNQTRRIFVNDETGAIMLCAACNRQRGTNAMVVYHDRKLYVAEAPTPQNPRTAEEFNTSLISSQSLPDLQRNTIYSINANTWERLITSLTRQPLPNSQQEWGEIFKENDGQVFLGSVLALLTINFFVDPAKDQVKQAKLYCDAADMANVVGMKHMALYYATQAEKLGAEIGKTFTKVAQLREELAYVIEGDAKLKTKRDNFKRTVLGLVEKYEKDGIYSDTNRMLRTAATNGCADDIPLIIALGADVNSQAPSNGRTALHWAALKSHKEVVTALVRAGAKMNIPDYSKEKVTACTILQSNQAGQSSSQRASLKPT